MNEDDIDKTQKYFNPDFPVEISFLGDSRLEWVRLDELVVPDLQHPDSEIDALRHAMGMLTHREQAEATVTVNAQRLRALWYEAVRIWEGKPILSEIAAVLDELRELMADALRDGGMPRIELSPVKGRTWPNGDPKDLVRLKLRPKPRPKNMSDAMNKRIISTSYWWDEQRKGETEGGASPRSSGSDPVPE